MKSKPESIWATSISPNCAAALAMALSFMKASKSNAGKPLELEGVIRADEGVSGTRGDSGLYDNGGGTLEADGV